MTLTKKCNKCGIEKPVSCFNYRARSKDKLQPWCKDCVKKTHSEWYLNNKNKIDDKHRKYIRENLEKERKRQKEYYEKNKAKIAKKNHERYLRTHEPKIKKTPEEKKLARQKYLTEYRLKNRDKINEKRMNRLRIDPIFARRTRLQLAVRGAILLAQKNGTPNKKSLAKTVTGLSPEKLWRHLLKTWKQRYGTEWNGEKYNIDHIIPCCSAIAVEEIDSLFYYKNLQLLTPEDNTKKKKQDLKFTKLQNLDCFCRLKP